MKRLLLFILLTSVAATLGYSQAAQKQQIDRYEVNTQKSTMRWTGRSIKGSHFGTINIKEGMMKVVNDRLVSATFVFDMSSINCNSVPQGVINANIISSLKAEDFFNASQFPTSTLEIVSVTYRDASKVQIKGFLTIKGIRQPTDFEGTVNIANNVLEGKAPSIVVSRSNFNLGFNTVGAYEKAADDAVDGNFELKVDITANKTNGPVGKTGVQRSGKVIQ